MRRQLLPLMGALILLGGCALAPKYARPAAPVPPSLPVTAADPSDAPVTAPWQEFITDGRLRSVVDLVLAGNRDLRVAALNAERVGAAYRIQRSELFPGVGAQGSVDVSRVPRRLSSTGQAMTADQYALSVGLSSWELDLFGRIRSLKDQALNQYLAAQQVELATRTSLVAATATTYLALAADAENRALADSTLKAQQESLDLIQRSRDAGVASDLDVRQAQSQVESARVALARYAGLVDLDRHALDLLAGRPVPADLLPDSLQRVEALKGVSAGLSSDVLLRRPDILAAEFQLKGANASIGAARAAFFPRISLTAGLGLVSPELSSLGEWSSRTFSVAPEVIAPIFAGGALKANLQVARVNRDLAVAQYEKAIQSAFREASDALTLRTTLVEQRTAQEALVHALQETRRLAEARYRAGMDGYLGVLVAERSLFGARQALVSVRLAEQQNLVSLYKVLGGGV